MARARVRKGQGAYLPEATREAKAGLALRFGPWRGSYPKPVRVHMELWVYVARWRGDWDNLAKLVCDALKEAGVYTDDRQVWVARTELVEVATLAEEGYGLRLWAL